MAQVRVPPSGPFVELAGGGQIVASAIGKNTAVPAGTVLYTAPVGKSGLYRLTFFTGVASANGSGQVFVIPSWPEFPPGTGNLQFMSPAPAAPPNPGVAPDVPQCTFVMTEGSQQGVPEVFTWWLQEGQSITYEVQDNDSLCDFVWCLALEALVVFSNPNP